jgi:hypothetical protein
VQGVSHPTRRNLEPEVEDAPAVARDVFSSECYVKNRRAAPAAGSSARIPDSRIPFASSISVFPAETLARSCGVTRRGQKNPDSSSHVCAVADLATLPSWFAILVFSVFFFSLDVVVWDEYCFLR